MAKVATWIPDGDYVDFFTGVIYTGGRILDMYRNMNSIPVLAKTGSIIPMTEQTSAAEAGRNPERLYLRVFAGANGKFTMYEDDNESMDYMDGDGAFTDFYLDWETFSKGH